MIIVSDTTAISNLIQIGELELLRALYKEIVIPQKVYDELMVLSELGISIEETLEEEWIKIKKVSSKELFSRYQKVLDQGEAEAIVLAIELRADYLLIDEKEGRKVARENDINIVGTIGILISGKKIGMINSIQEKMDNLRKIGFWISDSLYDRVIAIEKKL